MCPLDWSPNQRRAARSRAEKEIMTTNTNELHAAIYTTQTLPKQAADVIEHNMKSLAEAHTRNGIIDDTEVQASIESDADLIAELRAAALPWDQRHKSTERPPRRAHQFPAEQVAAVRAELQGALQAHGLDPKNSETVTQTFEGLPMRKLRTLLSEDHGWSLNGVSIERTEEDGTTRRGAVTTGGMVLWWNRESELISMSKEDAKSVMKALHDFDGWADHGCPPSTAVGVEIMRGALAKREPTDSMGIPLSCGKPLCAHGDHHPLCKLATPPAAQPAAAQEPVGEIVCDALGALRTQWNDDWSPNEGDKLYTEAPAAQPAPCTWTQSNDPNMPDTYSATCGAVWTFTAGGPAENNMRFCPECGKPAEQKGQK